MPHQCQSNRKREHYSFIYVSHTRKIQSLKYLCTNFRIRKILTFYKKIVEEKLTKTNTLLRIRQYIHTENTRMIDKNKNNLKIKLKLLYQKPDNTLPTKPLNITTLNIKGRHNDNKGNKTFKLLINRKIDIAFLQETHSTPEAIQK